MFAVVGLPAFIDVISLSGLALGHWLGFLMVCHLCLCVFALVVNTATTSTRMAVSGPACDMRTTALYADYSINDVPLCTQYR